MVKRNVTFRIDPEIYEAFKRLCQLNQKSSTKVINEFISEYLLRPKDKKSELKQMVEFINSLDIKDK